METEEAEQNLAQGNDAPETTNAEPMIVENPTAPGANTEEEPAFEEEPAQEMINIPSSVPEASPSRMQFSEDVMDEFPVDDVLHFAFPREMLPLFRPDVPHGGPTFNRRKHKPHFFGNNPYLNGHDSYSLRFWTQEQAIYYARTLMHKEKIIKHQYLDLPSLYAIA